MRRIYDLTLEMLCDRLDDFFEYRKMTGEKPPKRDRRATQEFYWYMDESEYVLDILGGLEVPHMYGFEPERSKYIFSYAVDLMSVENIEDITDESGNYKYDVDREKIFGIHIK